MARRNCGVSAVDVAFAACTLTVLCSVLSPVVATSRGGSALATCQVNLKRIGGAMRMYLTDWDKTYPTNRLYANTGQNATPYPNWEVPLGVPGLDSTGSLSKSRYGICWVEGLYSYIEPIGAPNAPNVWKCPAASTVMGSSGMAKASSAVSYVINFNLLEQPEGASMQDSTLMLLREIDCLVASTSRGGSKSGANILPASDSTRYPRSAFLTASDEFAFGAGSRQPLLHGPGSNILFADGHVKLFEMSVYYPNQCTWDPTTKRWYNNATNTTSPSYKTISVSR